MFLYRRLVLTLGPLARSPSPTYSAWRISGIGQWQRLSLHFFFFTTTSTITITTTTTIATIKLTRFSRKEYGSWRVQSAFSDLYTVCVLWSSICEILIWNKLCLSLDNFSLSVWVSFEIKIWSTNWILLIFIEKYYVTWLERGEEEFYDFWIVAWW